MMGSALPARGPAEMPVRRLSAYRARFMADAWAYAVFALYTAVVSILALAAGQPQVVPKAYYMANWVKPLHFLLPALWLMSGYCALRATHPLRSFMRDLFDPNLVCGVTLYLMLGFFMGTFTSAKTLMTVVAPFSWDGALAGIDAALHGGDAWRLFPLDHGVTRLLQHLYYPVWLFLLAGTSLYAAVFADPRLRLRLLTTFFFCWIVLGNVVAVMFLSGGPVFFESMTGSDRYRALTDYLQFSRSLPFSSVDLADRLQLLAQRGQAGQGTGISAFPSLHLAMATLWMLALAQVRRWLIWPMAGFLLAIQVASVHLGWHYAIDGYASIAVTWIAWKVIGAWMERRERAMMVDAPRGFEPR